MDPFKAADHDLTGLSVLVVEDSFLIADMIMDVLVESGCRVIGPVSRLQQALAIVQTEAFDGAFLDINLRGEFSFPIADTLLQRGIAFAFLTGYGEMHIPEKYRFITRLQKPVANNELVSTAAGFRGAASA